jgi:hypothetical protein
MTICSLTPLHTPLSEYFSIDDVRTLVAKQVGVDLEFVTSETHFTNDLGADLEMAPELTGHGLPLSKCEAYNRVYDQFYQSR